MLRISQNSLSSLDLLAAKTGGAKILSFRSSNAGIYGGKLGAVTHKLFKPMANFVPNVRLAPSEIAAEFMFGKKSIKKNKVFILKNGIDIDYYKFDPAARLRIREQYNVSDKFVVGHIGRFNFQKNHKFLIDIFYSLHKMNPNSFLFLIGDGETKTDIENYTKELGINEFVKFFGVLNNIPEMNSAIDVLVLPSLFEGMPNVVIEAQASGAPCVISNTITQEANITGTVQYLPLSDSADRWAEIINLYRSMERKDVSGELKKQGYSIDAVLNNFISYIFGE